MLVRWSIAAALAVCFVLAVHAQDGPKKTASQKVDEYEQQMRSIPRLDRFRLAQMKLGDLFRGSEDTALKVVQVIGAKEVHLGIRDALCCVRGMPTKGLVDDRPFELPKEQVFEVKDTKMFKTVLGGTRTIFVLEPVELKSKPSPPEYAQAKAEEEAERRRRDEARRKAEEQAEREAAEQAKKDAARKVVEDAARAEKAAAASLGLTKQLIEKGKGDFIRARLERLIREYPNTKAAKEAREMLKRY